MITNKKLKIIEKSIEIDEKKIKESLYRIFDKMAYKTEDLYKKAVESIVEDENLTKIKYLCSCFLGVVESTFYDHFPKDSKQYKTITGLLRMNKAKVNYKIEKGWRKAENNAIAQKMAFLLNADSEEREIINPQYKAEEKEPENSSEKNCQNYIDNADTTEGTKEVDGAS